MPPITTRPPTMKPAMTPGDMAPPRAAAGWLLGSTVGTVFPVVVGLLVDGAGAVAVKATTWFAEAASRRPSPTLGVGKWLAGVPIDVCCRTPARSGIEPIEGTALGESPDQARRHDGRAATRPSTPQQTRRGRRPRHSDRGDAGKARKVNRHAHHGVATVHVAAAYRSHGGVMAADSAEVRSVEEIRGVGLPGYQHLAAGQQGRRRRQIEIVSVVRPPVAR